MKYIVFVPMVLIAIVLVVLSLSESKEKNEQMMKKIKEKKNGPRSLSQEEIDEIDKSINKEKIIDHAFVLYKKMFEEYSKYEHRQKSEYNGENAISILKEKLENNYDDEFRIIRKDTKLLDGRIVGIYSDNKFEYLNISLEIEEIRYKINTKTNEAPYKKDMKPKKERMSILLKREIDYKEDEECPTCGNKLNPYESLQCMKCGELLIKKTEFYIEDYHEDK